MFANTLASLKELSLHKTYAPFAEAKKGGAHGEPL